MATCATRINILTAVHMDDTLGQSENRSSAIELLLNCSIGSALSRDPMLLLIRAKCRFHLAPNVNEQLHIDTNQVSIVNFSLTWRNVITAVTTSPHLLNQTQWIDYSLNTADYDHDTVQVWWLLFFFWLVQRKGHRDLTSSSVLLPVSSMKYRSDGQEGSAPSVTEHKTNWAVKRFDTNWIGRRNSRLKQPPMRCKETDN